MTQIFQSSFADREDEVSTSASQKVPDMAESSFEPSSRQDLWALDPAPISLEEEESDGFLYEYINEFRKVLPSMVNMRPAMRMSVLSIFAFIGGFACSFAGGLFVFGLIAAILSLKPAYASVAAGELPPVGAWRVLLFMPVVMIAWLRVTQWRQRLAEVREHENLLKTGQPVDADVVGLEFGGLPLLRRRPRRRLVAQWRDPGSGRTYRFRSAAVREDFVPMMKSTKVRVFVDPANPQRHAMDLRIPQAAE